jgi:hypothetical protein
MSSVSTTTLCGRRVSRMARDELIGTDGDGLYYHLSQLSQLSRMDEEGVTPVTGVTADIEGTNGRNPCFGDEGYLDFIAAVHRAGHITTGEALQRERIHKGVLKAQGE